MPHAELPTAGELAHTYTALVRRQVSAKAGPRWSVPIKPQAFVGVYEDAHHDLEGLWIADIELAATLGAVLTLIPPAVAAQAVAAKTLPEELLEGAREIANITANNFHDKRVRLAGFYTPGEPLSPIVTELLSQPLRRLDISMTVAGYTGGRLLILGR